MTPISTNIKNFLINPSGKSIYPPGGLNGGKSHDKISKLTKSDQKLKRNGLNPIYSNHKMMTTYRTLTDSHPLQTNFTRPTTISWKLKHVNNIYQKNYWKTKSWIITMIYLLAPIDDSYKQSWPNPTNTLSILWRSSGHI